MRQDTKEKWNGLTWRTRNRVKTLCHQGSTYHRFTTMYESTVEGNEVTVEGLRPSYDARSLTVGVSGFVRVERWTWG